MNECARTRRHDAVFAVSRGVRAAFARRASARARDRPLRADAGFARPRARVSRAARANPLLVRGRPIVSRQTRDLARSADRFAAMYCIREISRIQHAIRAMIQNADARSRARTAARVADGGDCRDAAIVIETYRSMHAMYEISHVYTYVYIYTRARRGRDGSRRSVGRRGFVGTVMGFRASRPADANRRDARGAVTRRRRRDDAAPPNATKSIEV